MSIEYSFALAALSTVCSVLTTEAYVIRKSSYGHSTACLYIYIFYKWQQCHTADKPKAFRHIDIPFSFLNLFYIIIIDGTNQWAIWYLVDNIRYDELPSRKTEWVKV